MTKGRVTVSRSGHLFVIKKGGHEVGYAQNKTNAKKRANAIRDGRDY